MIMPHIFHEFNSFYKTALILRNIDSYKHGEVLSEFVGTAFLLHFRILGDFLFTDRLAIDKNGRYKNNNITDVFACDYLPRDKYDSYLKHEILTFSWENIESFRFDTNKYLAHLTTDRLKKQNDRDDAVAHKTIKEIQEEGYETNYIWNINVQAYHIARVAVFFCNTLKVINSDFAPDFQDIRTMSLELIDSL